MSPRSFPCQVTPHQLSRRQALLGILGLGGTITGLAVNAGASEHPEHPVAPLDSVSMLYDNTMCTDAKPACRRAMRPTACPRHGALRRHLGPAGGSQLEDKKHHQALSGARWTWLLLR